MLWPRAFSVCDRCGFVYNHKDLIWQNQWVGPRLQNLRVLVCDSCVDKPQDQLRTLLIPADPVPIDTPRPENYTAEVNINLYVFNPDDMAPYLTLSTGTETVTSNNPVDFTGGNYSWVDVRSATFKYSGKWCFQVDVNFAIEPSLQTSTSLIGLADSGAVIEGADAWAGIDQHSVGLIVGLATASAGLVTDFLNTASLLPFDILTTGIGSLIIAVDIDNALIWVKGSGDWNGDPTADPATGVGGFSIASLKLPMMIIAAMGLANDTATVNVIPDASLIPAGFEQWGLGSE